MRTNESAINYWESRWEIGQCQMVNMEKGHGLTIIGHMESFLFYIAFKEQANIVITEIH